MFGLTLTPALALLGALQRLSPVRPLHTLMRSAEDRRHPRHLQPHEPVVRHRQDGILGCAGAGLHQRATILVERGRGGQPTIVLGGFVPDATEQVFLLRQQLLRRGDVFYVNYAATGFSLDLVCAQLADLTDELAAAGRRPVLLGVSFGAGLLLEQLRRDRAAGGTAPVAGIVLVSPVACVADVLAAGPGKPGSLVGRALKPHLEAGAGEKQVENSRVIFARMFESGAKNRAALRMLMTAPEAGQLREAVLGTIQRVTAAGARERVQALRALPAPPSYFAPGLLPLTAAPVLVLYAESEESVLDRGSPTRFAFEAGLRAYFPSGRLKVVTALPGAAPVQHASLIFHAFEFRPHLEAFYTRLKSRRLRSAA